MPSTAPCVVAELGAGDAGEALTVQHAAYLAEARRYGTTEIGSVRLRGDRVGTGETGRLVDSGGVELLRLERPAPGS